MNQDFKGINTTKLEDIRNEIKEYSEEVFRVLKKIDTTLEDSHEYLSDDLTDTLKRKYEDLSANYIKIYNNLQSISDEFIRINYRYREEDEQISKEVNAGNVNFGN